MSISRSAQGFAATALLLAGTSFLALTLNAPGAHARALNGGSGGAPAPAIASEAAAQAAQQAVAATRQTQESLARAARAMQDIQGVQAAARAAAAAAQMSVTAPVAVPNGLGAGGLLPNAPQNWLNANAPTQSVDGNGQTQVGIRQTGAQAILNWTSFNVGARTTLTFDQQGRRDWVALNRVDRTTGPSQILGNIKADGQVYVINQSGIIFGGNSQVNVGSLIASTAGITDSQFRTNGIYSDKVTNTYLPSFTAAGGQVVVEAGASIATSAPTSVTSGGGFVLMLGSEVSNAGSIATPKGQTILAAGRDFILRPGFGTDANKFSTINGSEVAPVIGTATGKVTNTGIVWAQQGDVTMAGRTLLQSGALLSSTAVNQRGSIHLLNSASDTSGSVTLAAGSLTHIIPELNSTDTALNSQRDALATNTRNPEAIGQFDNLSALVDRRDQSRVEIVTGGLVNFQNGSLTMAQGGQIAVSAGNRVFAEQGAVIDVSGVSGARLAMSANQVQVNVQGNELRDSPVNRDSGALVNRNVWIDIRDLVYVAAGTGGYAGERYYTKGGLLEVGGYVANTAHTIGEWAAVGGTITLAGPQVVAQQGATFNIAGGAVSFDGGWIYSSKLLGTDGRIYSFDDAPASMKFVGVAGGFVRTHNISGKLSEQLTEVWTTVFDRTSSRQWENGYTVGRDAGRLNLSTPTAVFEADVIADVIKGERQTSVRAANVADGYKQAQNSAPLQGTLGLGRYDAFGAQAGVYGSDVRFTDVASVTAALSATDALPSARTGTAWFDSGKINAMRLGGVDIGTADTIVVDRAVTLADGGRINLNAAIVDIRADITVRGGSLTVDNYYKGNVASGRGIDAILVKDGNASVTVRNGVTLDMRGLWVNALDNPADNPKQAFVNGGSVTLRSTQDVTLEKGSIIDVSSGAAVLTSGKTKGGRGGDVTLIADQQNPNGDPADGLLTLDGEIRAYGVSGGGTLRLESGTSVAIGGKILATEGVLGAGEKAPTDLVLLQDYLVKAGEVLPGDYTYQSATFMAGDRLIVMSTSILVPYIQNIVLAADWTVPFGNANQIYSIQTSSNGSIRIPSKAEAANVGSAPIVLRAGTVISIGWSDVSAIDGYILPGNVFPAGIAAMRYQDGINMWVPAQFAKTIAAGTVAPSDLTLAAGSRIFASYAPVRAADVKPILQIESALFQSGFSSYDIAGRNGVVVADGAIIDVAMPVYRFRDNAYDNATGTDPSRALAVWTPPEWTEDARNGRLTHRAGASVTLRTTQGEGTGVAASGPLSVGTGASIRVDAGQSISLQGLDITIDGTLTAPGGIINVTQPIASTTPSVGGKASVIWIGEHAVLDVAARAVTGTDWRGQTYGIVGNGGSILIGGALDWDNTGTTITPTSFVVIRPGALLDASGTSAVLDIPASGLQKDSSPLAVASNGGSIIIKSGHGLYLDGTLRAFAGGANAAGGTLGLALEALHIPNNTVSGDVLRHRELVIADIQGDSAIAGAASMEAAKAGLVTGTARLGVDRIKAGGFENLSVLVDGLLSFDGNVNLAMAQSLRLYARVYGITDNSAANARVALSAPYIRLAAATRGGIDYHTLPVLQWDSGYGKPTQRATDAVFGVTADLIEIRDRVVFGVRQTIDIDTSRYTVDRRGFALVDLVSRGDIRTLAATAISNFGTALQSPGNIDLTAAQIYPASGVFSSIVAGYTMGSDDKILASSVLNIRRYGDVIPDLPYSAFGGITLAADTVNQGGVVRAPFGSITLGSMGSGIAQADTINLLPGSITSVSGAGLVMPYGGTLDGITYSYNGTNITLSGAGGLTGVNLTGVHVNAQAGAVVDVSGGGELSGAGFVSGRGGSVNVLTTALVNSNPGSTYSAKGNEVYAIVPGRADVYAPAVQEAGYGLPSVGRQITIPDGVPGLPAGTYTLMPATYALLPGAYRVELGASTSLAAPGVVPVGNGSHIVRATLGVANTDIRSSLPNQVIITASNTVRTHSYFNEMSYNEFVLADAVRIGAPRAAMTIDSGALTIQLDKPRVADGRSQFQFNSDLRIRPEAGSDGYAGTVSMLGVSEILPSGRGPTPGMLSASVYADEINKLDAPRLLLNTQIGLNYGDQGRTVSLTGLFGSIVLRSGAHLSAAEVIFGALGRTWLNETGSIIIEEGATVSTIGRGPASFDSRDGYSFSGMGVLVVSNGWVDLRQSEYRANSGMEVDINIGGCITADCNRTAVIVSEGTIAAATAGTFSIGSSASYGTRNLVLGLSAINLGEDARLAAAAAAGQLPMGLALNGTVLSQLFAGNTATGAPALEALVLNARNSVNVFGDVTLDASKVGRLVFGTPAIYGYGSSGETATIRAGEFVWTGIDGTPAASMLNLLGDSRLNIAANRVVFGYGPNSQRPNNKIVDNRIVLGFTDVNITASEYVTSNNASTLGVYHRQGAYHPETGYQYSGGNLTITAPVFTGAAASNNTITAGGDIRVVGTGGAIAPNQDLGAQIKMTGANITIDGSIVLPSGRLALTATGDIVLSGNSRLDLAGRGIQLFDVTKYSWGGDLVMTSNAGNIRQDAGSVIDLSAQNNRGGTAAVTALAASAGHVALGGTILGGASGLYDAGGTIVPYDAAEIEVRAQTLADFGGLNARLNAGSVFGARRFQIKQGNLVVGDDVKARRVEITVDGGSLTVAGTIDASGYQVGSIRLAAMGDLIIGGKLDAHGAGMRFDSYGKIIDAANRATIDLTSRQGTLTLTSNATIDLRAGTDVAVGSGAGFNDGAARGTLTLNAPRVGGTGGQGGINGAGNGANDVALAVIGTPSISGARTVAVYGYRTYDDAPLATAPDVTGHKPQEITQAYLEGYTDQNGVFIGGIDPHNTSFIDAARLNADLSGRLARLGNARLRPGVDIVSKISVDNPNGDLTINGDLDLSGYRYGPNANSPQRGFGEPGAINFRAAGNLNIRGTVNDGFAPPPATSGNPDTNGDKGWLLEEGVIPYGGDLVLPIAVTLETGTRFKQGAKLNYDLPTGPVSLPTGAVLPVRATLAGSLTLGAGTVLDAAIYNANGTVAYPAGTLLTNTVTLTAGMQLDAGTVLRAATSFAAMTWPKGVPLPVDMTSTAPLMLAAGALIPGKTDVKLAGGSAIELRDSSSGRQGANWAIAPMLAAGATSWDMQFTAGADLGSANPRARNANKTGSIVLADTHYVSRTSSGGVFMNLSEAGALALLAAIAGDYPSLTVNDLIGKSESEVIAFLGGSSWQDFVDFYGMPPQNVFWNPSAGNIELGLTLQGVRAIVGLNGLPFGIGNERELVNLTRRQLSNLYDPGSNYSWTDFGMGPTFGDSGQGNLDTISLPPTTTHSAPSFSLVRTGTGNLSLNAAGNITMSSLYGVYTAGTATVVDPTYTRARGTLPDGSLLGSSSADFASATAVYQAWYPDQGGNVLIDAGGNLAGDIYGRSQYAAPSSVITGNWLWRQGTGSTVVDTKLPTSWWINFGTYVANTDLRNNTAMPDLIGFTGIGALGGGNVAIRVGGEAGAITLRGDQAGSAAFRSQGLVVAVGSTGRVGLDGSLTLTGGGDIDMRIAGALNPNLALSATNVDKHALAGSVIDLRGTMLVNAGSIGGIKPIYIVQKDSFDPRALDPYVATQADARSGITLVPGDATVTVETRGDLVLGGAGDPTRSFSRSESTYSAGGVNYVGGGQTWFSLWTPHTAVNLIAAGGNLTPLAGFAERDGLGALDNPNSDTNISDGAITLPSIFRAAALGGNIYSGKDALAGIRNVGDVYFPFAMLAPSPRGTLEMLAGNSIYAGQYGFSLSGTGTPMPTPFNPAFTGREVDPVTSRSLVTNAASDGTVDANGNASPGSLFVFGPNSAVNPVGRAEDADPIRFYAGTGDIVGLYTGETLSFSIIRGQATWYVGSGPLRVRAGRDIVGAGLPPDTTQLSNISAGTTRGNLIVHSYEDDVSVVSAGRDIINANFDIAGPGAFEMSAGRNLYQGDKGGIVSRGPIAIGDTRPGASVTMLAGVGPSGPDYDGFAALYLDPARLAVSGTPLADQHGKVAKTYEKELVSWLKERYGFIGSDAEARAYFGALAPEQRNVFLRSVYFAELTAGGREYNNTDSPRFRSYLRGREAIAALFPDRPGVSGDLTMFGASGVRTLSGGDIQLLAPHGRSVIGIEGRVPPASAGLVTQGSGDIQLYAQGSILLGLSRIMTTFGGDVIAWSAEGDINAGRGSKTTTIYTPPKRVYDKYGRAVLSPQAPSAGAGIATLNPIAGVVPGDVDLIAPLGTIDAGEAGIRVSGNVNLAALQILNAANIQVQGTSTGIPTVQAPSISAALSTSNATAASQQTATPNQGAGNAQPSVIIVEVLGYGGGDGSKPTGEEEKPRQRSERSYNHNSAFQVVGVGELNETEMQALSESERKALTGP